MMTKLEAVNQMLDAIGESAVSTLQNVQLDDAADAVRKLDSVSREVQNKGWHCNTEQNVRLTPDVSGEIKLPSNTLRVDTVGDSKDLDVVLRGTKLYDRGNRTTKFSAAIYLDMTLLLDFEELSFALQNYIVARAGRIFQEGNPSSVSLDRFTSRREEEAWAQVLDEEAENDDTNMLSNRTSSAIRARSYNAIP